MRATTIPIITLLFCCSAVPPNQQGERVNSPLNLVAQASEPPKPTPIPVGPPSPEPPKPPKPTPPVPPAQAVPVFKQPTPEEMKKLWEELLKPYRRET